MICRLCNSPTIIANSRTTNNFLITWRRHTCLKCGRKFTTREQEDLSSFKVSKRGQKKIEKFSELKLSLSIYEAIRPLGSLEQAHHLAKTITGGLDFKKQPLDSIVIGNEAQKVLKRFNQGAYLRYRSLQRDKKI